MAASEALPSSNAFRPNEACTKAFSGSECSNSASIAKYRARYSGALSISSPYAASNEAIASLEKAVELDPFNAVFQKKLVLRFIEMKDYAQAGAALKRYVEKFSQDSFMRQMLPPANFREKQK